MRLRDHRIERASKVSLIVPRWRNQDVTEWRSQAAPELDTWHPAASGDHVCFAKSVDLLRRQAEETGQNLVGVLADRGCGADDDFTATEVKSSSAPHPRSASTP